MSSTRRSGPRSPRSVCPTRSSGREVAEVLGGEAGVGVVAQVPHLQAPTVDYGAIAPVLIVLGAACLSVLVEAFVARSARWSSQVALTLLTLGAAGAALGVHLYSFAADGRNVVTLAGTISVDGPALFLWGTLLALGLAAVLLIADRSVEPGGAFSADAAVRPGTAADRAQAQGAVRTAETVMQTEVFPLFLFSLGGMMVFLAANDLLTMFVALEVLSLPLYLMCGLARRRRLLAQEAAVKYFLLGAFSSAFFLYGVALLYGYAGSGTLHDIAAAASSNVTSSTLLYAGIGLLGIGLLFKIGAAPFQSWKPDVYQGAPTPVTALMASCTVVAAFGALLRVFYVAFGQLSWNWRPAMWVVAILTMLVGAIIAITQTDVKRLLAYSSIAHGGFVLTGVVAATVAGLSSSLFYLAVYGFTTVGAFAVVTLVRDPAGEANHLSRWAGLGRRSPLVAGMFAFFLFAFAGIPLTSGFI